MLHYHISATLWHDSCFSPYSNKKIAARGQTLARKETGKMNETLWLTDVDCAGCDGTGEGEDKHGNTIPCPWCHNDSLNGGDYADSRHTSIVLG